MPFLASEGCFWPLTAFMRSDVKINHVHVETYRILNKLSEINFSIGCMVWPGFSSCLVGHLSNIDEIPFITPNPRIHLGFSP